MACRNRGRAEAVRAALLAARPSAQVSTVQVDVSDLRSVLRAARELRRRWASLTGFLTVVVPPAAAIEEGPAVAPASCPHSLRSCLFHEE